MPKLPSFPDVGNVSPTIQRDPGVSAPVQAFESGSGIVAQELVSGIDQLAQAQLRHENRRDTVDRSDKINRYQREAEDELRRLNVESDLSREDVMNEYGAFLTKRRNSLLEEHGGSNDSRAALTMRLQDIESQATGKAAGISTALGRQKVLTTFENGVSPLASRVADDPTPKSINQAFIDLETQLNDLRGAFDPNEEESLRAGAREQITASAFGTLIARGQVEAAAAMIDSPDIAQSLSANTQRDIRRKIETVRYNRDEALRKVGQMEAILGRPLSQGERLSAIGLSKSEELVEIHDPTSPSKIRLVPKSQAVGQPGVPKRPLVEQTNVGTIPPGYQLVRDPTDQRITRMEPIPGGPADVESKARQRQQQEQSRLTARQSKLVVRDVDRSLAMIKESWVPAAGAIAGSVPVPGTPAFQLQRQLDSIKARIGFDQLQAMRAASPTGGALGQVSERENVLLQSVLGSLDARQDVEILSENLAQIREIYLDAWFGTPEEHQAAIEDGRLTPEQVKNIQKERESIGFDAIGRALDPGFEESKKVTPSSDNQEDKSKKTSPTVDSDIGDDDIMAMTMQELSQLELNKLSDEQLDAVERRFNELGR